MVSSGTEQAITTDLLMRPRFAISGAGFVISALVFEALSIVVASLATGSAYHGVVYGGAGLIETCMLIAVEPQAYLAEVIGGIDTGHPRARSTSACPLRTVAPSRAPSAGGRYFTKRPMEGKKLRNGSSA